MSSQSPTPEPGSSQPMSVGAPDEPSGMVDMSRVLHGEEINRARVFFRIILAICVATGLFVPFLAGAAWLRLIAGGLLAGMVVLCVVVLIRLRRDEHYTPRFAAVVGALCAAFGVVIIYYIGLFSAAAMVLCLGIYFFGLSHSRLVARTAYGIVAGLYLLVTGAIAAGVLTDLSLFSTEDAGALTRWFQVVMSQVIFAMTFYLARRSRRATEDAIEQVQSATVQLRKRDALLAEARGELARALAPGEGRHTGSVLGSYRLGELIGRGAMGDVYRAECTDGTAAAVKILHPNLSDDPEQVGRFMREAEAAAAVKSEHIPKMIATGFTGDGAPYLIMELLEGHDLGWHLRKAGKLKLSNVVKLCEQVARALADVRSAGVVHRDLKPGNLFLTDSLPRSWKVMDFGLSKILWAGTSLTRVDMCMGTPAYMAPEQIRGPRVDHQADLYALASIAYRAITGSPAFSGSEISHVIYGVLHCQPPDPTELVDLPRDVELVLAIGMAKQREDRFEQVEQFAAALAAAARGSLDDDLRARGALLLTRWPWGSTVRMAPPGR